MTINKKPFLEFVSNIKETNKIVSYSQEIDNKNFTDLIKHFLDSSKDVVYWSHPSQDFSFLALGEIFSLNIKDNNDLTDIQNTLFKVKKNHYHNLNKVNFNKLPLFIGAQKFPLKEQTDLWGEFPNRKWFIPKYLIINNRNYFSFIINILDEQYNMQNYLSDIENLDFTTAKIRVANNERNKHERIYINDMQDWSNIIYSSLEKISRKELEKVVTARKVELEIHSPVIYSEIISSLEDNYTNCYSFVYRKNGSIFFGSTPEKLFKVENGLIETDALAGSIQRGETELEDNELGMQLLESEKDLIEHNSVRNFLLEKLYHVTDDIQYECTPQLKKLSNIQHLWTPIKAKLKNDVDILSLIENIYPTPAICGYPTETALKLISNLEKFDRGLYAGAIGWFNFDDAGEFVVALRSALIKNNILHSFAGCGIVEGSNPVSEYKETELKLKPILSLFINETINQS